MLNINYGHNKKLMESCRPLWEYSWFTDKVRKGDKNKRELIKAINHALQDMPDDFAIKPFLIANKAEVTSMCITEYNEARVRREMREEAKAAVRQDISFRAEGYDIDGAALETAARNAQIAGVADLIRFEHRDLRDFKPAEGYQTVITNPPYGERLLSIEEAESLYRVMGERFIREKGKSYTVISPDDDFEKLFGRRADKRRKVYNGTLKCQIYQYFL